MSVPPCSQGPRSDHWLPTATDRQPVGQGKRMGKWSTKPRSQCTNETERKATLPLVWTGSIVSGYQNRIHKVTIQRTGFFKNVFPPATLNLERKGQGYILTFLSGPLLQRCRKASASSCQFSQVPATGSAESGSGRPSLSRSHPHCPEIVGEANWGSRAGPQNETDVKLNKRRKPYKLI